MKSLIAKDIKGARLADNHYLETGHRIDVKMKSTARNNKIEIIKVYKCLHCTFTSFCGELYQVYL